MEPMRTPCSFMVVPSLVWACAPQDDPEAMRFAPRATSDSAPTLDADLARELLAVHLLPGERLVEVIPWSLPVQGRVIAVGVITNATGARRIAVDEHGALTSFEDALAAEDAQHAARYGKMTKELFEKQRDLADDVEIEFDVIIRADVEPSRPPFDGTDIEVSIDQLNTHVRAHRDQTRARLAAAKQALKTWLELQGATINDYSALPSMTVRAPARVLRLVRLHDSDVVVLRGRPDPTKAQLLGFAGHGSMGETAMTGGLCGSTGCTGGLVGVGIWEFDPDHESESPKRYHAIATSNTRLLPAAGITYREQPTTCTTVAQCTSVANPGTAVACANGICVNQHRTVVASMIGMRDATDTGGVGYTYPSSDPGIGDLGGVYFSRAGTWNTYLYVANHLGTLGFNWLVNDTPALYANRSVTGGYAESEVNWAARNEAMFLTVASGNDITGATVTDEVTNASYWNALHVGNYRYESWNNVSTHRRHNSSMYGNESTFPGQERPHLLGPGSHLNLTNNFQGLAVPDITAVGANTIVLPTGAQAQVGTSFAAPAVLSAALQAHQYEGWFSNLYFPIVKKAILMASSVDSNADGQIGTGWEWTSTPDAQDGAGHPDFVKIKQILDNNRYMYQELTDSMFTSCGAGCREYTLGSFNVAPGVPVKAALVWNACPDAPYSNPATDLDLVLVQPAWCFYGLRQSASVNNEVEMIYDDCQVYSPVSGTYTVKVRIKNGGSLPATCGGFEPVAFAWRTGS